MRVNFIILYFQQTINNIVQVGIIEFVVVFLILFLMIFVFCRYF